MTNEQSVVYALTPIIQEEFALALAAYLAAGGTVEAGADRDRLFQFFQRGYVAGVVGADPDGTDQRPTE